MFDQQGRDFKMTPVTKFVFAICVALPASLAPVTAQQGITRTQLATFDYPPGYQTIIGRSEIPAHTCYERHTHPGLENFYVLEGEQIAKVGDQDVHLKANDAGQVAPGVPHVGCTQDSAMKVVTVHIIEKGKPLTTVVP
jgi:quercetin dioxygenase-like cupin family protein